MKNQGHKGSHTYTNGIKTILLFEGDPIPEGFYRGDSRKKNPGNRGLTVATSEKVANMEKTRKNSREYRPLDEEGKFKISNSMKGLNTGMKGSKRDPETIQKFKQTMQNKSESEIKNIVNKRGDTRKKNNTCNSSSIEAAYYKYLLSIYDETNIVGHYQNDSRYPFECDFYIKSEDLFIEINGAGTHYKEPFDPNNLDHLKLIDLGRSKHTKYYDSAIYVGSERDPLKLRTFIDNNLNYIIIYPYSNIILDNDNKPCELLETPFKDNQQLSLLLEGKFNDYRNDNIEEISILEQSRVESK